jgi:hypothetical protein
MLLSAVTSCKKSDMEPVAFSYENAVGVWVPYEIILEDGRIQVGPFTSSTHFGVYAESVQLNKDQSFIPVIWKTSTNYLLKNDEKGTYKYIRSERRLIL